MGAVQLEASAARAQAARGDALILFGATGDLARKKLYPALYRLAARGRLGIPVIGVALSDWDDDQLRDYARSAVAQKEGSPDQSSFDELTRSLALVVATIETEARSTGCGSGLPAPESRSSTSPSRQRCSRPWSRVSAGLG